MWWRYIIGMAASVGLTVLLNVAETTACEIAFRKPDTHFSGVNEFGYVSYWNQIGELDLGDGYSLPMVIGFRSDWNSASPYLGYGWFCAFDSRFTQVAEHRFEMLQIDGHTIPFNRDDKNPQLLHGAIGWKGEIKGKEITVRAPCGWNCVFSSGRLASVTSPRGTTLNIQRNTDGLALAGMVGPKMVTKVERDASGRVSGFLLNETFVTLQLVDKPQIQCIQGKNLLTSLQQSLGKVGVGEETWNFSYDPTNELMPALNIEESGKPVRRIVWDGQTLLIRSESDWTYEIKPAAREMGNADIRRTNSKGQKQRWFRDGAVGREYITNLDGVEIIKNYFVSGPASGAIRSEVQIKDGIETTIGTFSYDERGREIRELSPNRNTWTTYHENGRPKWHLIQYPDGSYSEEFYRDENGKTISYRINETWIETDSEDHMLRIKKDKEVVWEFIEENGVKMLIHKPTGTKIKR